MSVSPHSFSGGYDLTGHVAVITGGSAGIGRAVAERLGSLGATVLVAARSSGALDAAVEKMRATGIEAFGKPTDVREEREVDELFAYAESLEGQVSILVNSAGGSFSDNFKRGPLLDASANDLLEAYRLNVVSAFLCSVRAVAAIGEAGGSIVNVSSIGGVRVGGGGMAAYGASKAALNNLTKTMALEWAPKIRVNAVAPGVIDTERTTATRTPERLARQLRSVALGRMGTPEEVAELVLYLVSPAASWTTGSIYEMDGGFRPA